MCRDDCIATETYVTIEAGITRGYEMSNDRVELIVGGAGGADIYQAGGFIRLCINDGSVLIPEIRELLDRAAEDLEKHAKGDVESILRWPRRVDVTSC